MKIVYMVSEWRSRHKKLIDRQTCGGHDILRSVFDRRTKRYEELYTEITHCLCTRIDFDSEQLLTPKCKNVPTLRISILQKPDANLQPNSQTPAQYENDLDKMMWEIVHTGCVLFIYI